MWKRGGGTLVAAEHLADREVVLSAQAGHERGPDLWCPREFFAKMDAANVDLKAFTADFDFKLCMTSFVRNAKLAA